MKILPEQFLMVLSSSFAIGIWGMIVWKKKLWVNIMDLFKEGLPFERALEFLKKGKSIRRKQSKKGIAKMTVSVRGENKEKICEFNLEMKEMLRENPLLNMEDILATDWVVDD